MAKAFNLVDNASRLGRVFDRASKTGARCLTLNPNVANSPKKISLFQLQIQETTQNRRYMMTVSYVPGTETNYSFYTFDFEEMTNMGFQRRTQDQVGIIAPHTFLLQFLNDAATRIDRMRGNNQKLDDPKSAKHECYQFYYNILTGKDYKVRHAGNDQGGEWKYELNEQEEKEVLEAFASMFRRGFSIRDLNAQYGYSKRAEIVGESDIKDSNGLDPAASF